MFLIVEFNLTKIVSFVGTIGTFETIGTNRI
jgi:hypothetical protein